MKHDLRNRSWLSLLAAALLAAATIGGCAEINHLREAQDAFNQAATLEAANRFDPDPSKASAGGALQSAVDHRARYASVVASIDSLTLLQRQRLKADGLWSTAQALQAMAYWRLKNFDKAVAVADEAAADVTGLGARDAAMMMAMPGMVRNDQAYAKLAKNPEGDTAELTRIQALLTSAQTKIKAAEKGVADTKHPVMAYLFEAELAIFKNWRDYCLAQFPADNMARRKCVKERHCDADAAYREMEQRVGKETAAAKKKLADWTSWTGLSGTDGTCPAAGS